MCLVGVVRVKSSTLAGLAQGDVGDERREIRLESAGRANDTRNGWANGCHESANATASAVVGGGGTICSGVSAGGAQLTCSRESFLVLIFCRQTLLAGFGRSGCQISAGSAGARCGSDGAGAATAKHTPMT